MKKVLIIANPSAGKEEAGDYSKQLAQVLRDAHQTQVEIKYTEGSGDATEWASQAASQGFDTVFCLGGDGTVSETVTGLMKAQERPDFAFIPLGTVNDLGRALGYSMNPEEAIQGFAKVSRSTMDVGFVNGKNFINVIAIGPIAEKVMDTSVEDKKRLGSIAYVKDGLSALFSDESYQLEIEDGQGQIYQLETNLVIIGLTNSVGGMERMFPEAKVNDGLLHLVAIKGNTPLDTLQAGVDIGLNNDESENILKLSDLKFTIRAVDNEDIPTNIDGDEGEALPLDVKVEKQALNVLIYR